MVKANYLTKIDDLKGTLVKAVFVDVRQLTKLTVYYRSLQAIYQSIASSHLF